MSLKKLIFVVFAIVQSGWWAQASSWKADSAYYYRLYNLFGGSFKHLDVYNGGNKNNFTHLANVESVSGQYWRFTPVAGTPYVRIQNMFRGKTMCLDIVNGGVTNNQPHMVPCANTSGQMWLIHEESQGMRLTTLFRGDDMCLDTINGGPNNNQPILNVCGPYTGQYWTFRKTLKKW